MISSLSLQKQPKTAPSTFQEQEWGGAEYGKRAHGAADGACGRAYSQRAGAPAHTRRLEVEDRRALRTGYRVRHCWMRCTAKVRPAKEQAVPGGSAIFAWWKVVFHSECPIARYMSSHATSELHKPQWVSEVGAGEPRVVRLALLKASRRGRNKRGRRRSAAIPPNERSWENVDKMRQNLAANCDNMWQPAPT